MGLPEILKKVRVEIGMTQVEIARSLNLSFSTVNRWENGRARPNPLAAVTILAFVKEKGASQSSLEMLKAALRDDKKSSEGGARGEG
ncbi:MAG: helix-turn-helix transcriptional regulator [Oscillospiraceae bacterium]